MSEWPQIDREQALAHIKAVGYSEHDSIVFSVYPPKGENSRNKQTCFHHTFLVSSINWEVLENEIRSKPDYSIGFVINPGGTKIADILACRVHFFEFDNLSVEDQLQAWRTFDLPEPSLQIATGGKSVHQYFRLAEPDNPKDWRSRQERLLHGLLMRSSDNSLVKQNQVLRLAGSWHPSTKTQAAIISNNGKLYTAADIERCLPPEERPQKRVYTPPPNIDPVDIKTRYLDALKFVPGRGNAGEGGYTNAFRVLCALVKEFGPSEAEAIAEDWSPTDPKNGWDVAKKIDSIVKMGGLRADGGTIIGIARDNGWVDPIIKRQLAPMRVETLAPAIEDPIDDVDVPEPPVKTISSAVLATLDEKSDFLPLVVEFVFDVPDTFWICHNDKLHRWCGTHYEVLEDEQISPNVAAFLCKLPVINTKTCIARHPWARPKYVDESIRWMKKLLGKTDVNPANAINCRNGVVRWTWDESDNLQIDFQPHDPSLHFTYVTNYDYQPDCDRSAVNQLLAALAPDQRTTIQRVLGASLDLPKYRSKRGRPRALLMLGGGSNGKDTLRGVVQTCLGDRKSSICSLTDFRQYDQGRKFGIASLKGSCLNWPSENTEFVRLDDLQSVKNAISGDPLSYEVKGQQEESFVPNALLVFNCNRPPLLSGADEAVRTRWYVCEFSKTFTSTPTKPDELPADPRFKDDPDFISREIAPAFLNWLLEGLQDALKHGIDYSSGSGAMKRVRELSCHLWSFIEDQNIVADEEGVSYVSDVYETLRAWYRHEGVIDKDDRWVEGVLADRPVKAPHNLVERLQAVFPDIKTYKHPVTRRKVIQGIKFG